MKTLILSTCALVRTSADARASDYLPATASATALIREWRVLEMACRGSNDPAACNNRDSVEQELGQMGWCFNGYSSDRR